MNIIIQQELNTPENQVSLISRGLFPHLNKIAQKISVEVVNKALNRNSFSTSSQQNKLNLRCINLIFFLPPHTRPTE